MAAHLVLELVLLALQLEVALTQQQVTWYLRSEDSLSLQGSKSSLTLVFDIVTKY
jgi:hypothetical protein